MLDAYQHNMSGAAAVLMGSNTPGGMTGACFAEGISGMKRNKLQ